ncbi:MAG TPA: hypothetical protein VET85_08045 [Stellaceae bacterium]|nr:hypothetical protein [Stellaceae bacterium]
MRFIVAAIAAFLLLAPGAVRAADAISCSDIPQAEKFLGTLKPGPNTTAAQQHLDAAKQAKSDQVCVTELRQVDKYARRSYAADQRAAKSTAAAPAGAAPSSATPPAPHPAARPKCADFFHQNRPGGTDYHGPPVAGCP